VRATLRLPDGAVLDARPFVGLPPDWTDRVAVVGTPAYVLTIENLASFNRHAREVDDDGLIVLSNGFPGRATLGFLKHLDRLLPATVPFFHWGDVDRGGLRILRHLSEALSRPLVPHRMPLGPTAWADNADDIAAYLARADAQTLEQEDLDPVPPAAGTAPGATA